MNRALYVEGLHDGRQDFNEGCDYNPQRIERGGDYSQGYCDGWSKAQDDSGGLGLDDYDSMSTVSLENIYYECKLDDRCTAISERANKLYEPGSRQWLLHVAKECDRRGLI